jgi:hypothetical protein
MPIVPGYFCNVALHICLGEYQGLKELSPQAVDNFVHKFWIAVLSSGNPCKFFRL